ncbi:hypothetical protein ACFL6M_07005 [Candidatus Eisenbacteria bacterium]|uniref:Uncharacterized protein n=1 Tax=Eiseniibacteriota bacterium TaxID=2212470 RepID=A0ABV6YLW7_UNCEI
MTNKSGGVRRFGGRWVREGDQYKDRNRVPRAILSRFWYLLVPFLGIMWAHDSYVRPDVEDIKSQKNLGLKYLLDRQDDVRADISVIQTEAQTISDEVDTLYLPQVRLYKSINDSLVAIRTVYDESLPTTEVKLDSLRHERTILTADLDQLSATYRERSTTLEGLLAWEATLKDSILTLDGLIAMKSDELWRQRNPEEYRRREALFKGQGDYPRRDENPPRERGE